MSLTPPTDRRILFVDMNSFFASCEQADNPELRGKPVITVPGPGSCALSASYEAKAYGIKTGTLEKEARFLCPSVQVVTARPKRYMEYHHLFEDVLRDLTPRVTIRSVDEASIELFRNEDPWQLARDIKESIWRRLSPAINCSIGIAPNISLAKLASDMKKPNGLVEIRMQDIPHIYESVKLRDLCGINYGIERQMKGLGIYTVRALYETDPTYLRRYLGIIGYRWWLRLHGYESGGESPAERKSVSHSHVLPPDKRDLEAAYTTLHHLLAKVGRRLRRAGCMAQSINLYLRFVGGGSEGAHLRVTPTSDTLKLADHCRKLWSTINPNRPVLQIGIWTTDLVAAVGVPMPLFPEERRRQALSCALDKVNDRYGSSTIRFARADTEGSRAPDRISFTALFDIEHE